MMAPVNDPNTETITALALQAALGQLGQSEKPIGSNKGPMVDEYLWSVGLRPGFAWCQAFVYWCYEKAALQLGKPNPVIKTAGVHDCWSKSKKLTIGQVLQQPSLVQPGDQFILSFGSAGHTGIVEKTEGLTIYTIEGNSNTNGSREGYEVVRHQRSLNDKGLLGFIKYS